MLNYLTPHGKWHIHSTYGDNHRMLTLSRGMRAVLAQRPGRRGASASRTTTGSRSTTTTAWSCTRAVVSARIPRGRLHHLPLARAHDRRAEVAAARQPARRRAQQPDAHAPEADPDGRRLRAVHLPLQLLGPDRRATATRSCCVRKLAKVGVLRRRTPWTSAHRSRWCSTSTSASAATPASIACKNIWTDRKGAEYMWWNNVETKPGTGYPDAWEDQEKYKGGWQKVDGRRRAARRRQGARRADIFHNPNLPDDRRLLRAVHLPLPGPVRRARGRRPADRAPDLDDHRRADGDRGRARTGTTTSAARRSTPRNDPNLDELSRRASAQQLFEIERLVFFYLPRICNHCLNPACVAACPSGALYKRGEDGIVLLNQERCRAWRICVTACPYKKTYFNWSTGKSREVHPLLPAPRDRAGAGLLPLLRRPHPLPGRAALRRRPHRARPLERARRGAGRRRSAA